MNCGGRFDGASPGVTFEQLCKASFVKIADRAFAIGLDPFWMLDAEVVMNLELKRSYGLQVRSGNWSSQRFRRSEHHPFDKGFPEVVQIDALKICLRGDLTQ